MPRTVEQALKKFELVGGIGDQDKTACAMSLLAWVRNRGLVDHPPCVHRLIADLVIHANDTTTTANRKRLVAAHESILDTWYVPDIVIAWALCDTYGLDPYKCAKLVLKRIKQWQAKKPLVSVEKANLREVYLRRPYLGGANLRGADLGGAYLREAYLGGADLGEADLREADLRGADLGGANLRGADLGGADLREADLRGAVYTLPPGWTVGSDGLCVKI